MRKIKLLVIFILVIGIFAGCDKSSSLNNDSVDDISTADLYNILAVDGDAKTYELPYELEEAFSMLVEKMTLLGMLSEPETIGFIMNEPLYTINDAGYFYCFQTYDSAHATSNEHVTKMQTFYVDGYSGDIYQMEIRSDAKTYLTKLE